jgi:ubiquinone/menaquinone biosynthesis C-methylase UbiE
MRRNMDHLEAGNYWNENAEAWTVLARAGYDLYRDLLNTPAFFENLPAVKGLRGLDIGCGEGHNTRLLASLGAQMDAIDISEIFIAHAQAREGVEPQSIRYQVASALALPFAADTFAFATAFMSLMDVPDFETALREAHRVLKPGGFLQFSITHPCFNTWHRKNIRDASGKTIAIEVGDYFRNRDGELEEWIFGAAPEDLRRPFSKFKIPRFDRTLSQWVNAVIAAGFVLEHLAEPCPSPETIAQYPYLQDSAVVAYFLHFRCRKKEG